MTKRNRRRVVLGVALTLWAVFGVDLLKLAVGAVFFPSMKIAKALGVYDYSTERGR